MELLLAEMFGFQAIDRDQELQAMIDDVLDRYEDDAALSTDDLDAAAGGTAVSPVLHEGRTNH